ncbi:hypothetical protein A2160_01570 [Candidatus Beckwithbacteria bacterium RBG_13_42_9]|uniref:Uncharacterized protein n=1 Tax=Candidatus Beckwithbacteria bacterium RBG_13_42_9 TaxID=1797457 RepID=A0A1F5E956_9BACT|nr:MAG: hypothetical protein A2160_01570 [Candidatus Beckwithbacteria bacterium RBG_13_42_9]
MAEVDQNTPPEAVLAAYRSWLAKAPGSETVRTLYWNSPLAPVGDEITCVNGVKIFISEGTVTPPGSDCPLLPRTVTIPGGEFYTFYQMPDSQSALGLSCLSTRAS